MIILTTSKELSEKTYLNIKYAGNKNAFLRKTSNFIRIESKKTLVKKSISVSLINNHENAAVIHFYLSTLFRIFVNMLVKLLISLFRDILILHKGIEFINNEIINI